MQHDAQKADWEVFDSFDGGVAGSVSETNRAILIRLKDPIGVARAQGATAAFAASLAPATIEARVYEAVAMQIGASLGEKNVEADVTVVEPAGWTEATNMVNLGSDFAYILGGAGVAGVLYWLFRKGKK